MGNFTYPVRVPLRVFQLDRVNGVLSSSLSGGFETLKNFDIKNGSSVPGYKAKLLNGLDATSTYRRSGYQNLVAGRIRMRSLRNWGGTNHDSSRDEVYFNSNSEPSYSYDANAASSEASSILKRKLRDFTGQSNQLTNVLELRELPKTISAVAGSATKLVKTLLESKRRGGDLRRFASDQWLTWSFGVLPTLGAVDDAISSVQSYLDRKDHGTREYGVYQTEWRSRTQVGPLAGCNHYSIMLYGRFKHTLSVKLTAGYRYELLSSNNYTLDKHLGFDISSVIPTAWELLPFSWLYDYFTTAGQFLEDTFSADFGKSTYIVQNTRFRVEGEVDAVANRVFKETPLVEWSTSPAKLEYFAFRRDPVTALPRAPLRFKTTDEIANNAVNKLLNLTSILGSKR